MALPTNKFEMKIRQDDDSFVCEITNGSISICVSNDGEEEDMQAIVDALNKPNVKWYSNNKLELDQHIEIMQLQDELRREKEKSQKLAEALEMIEQMSDPGSYEKAVYAMKSIASDTLSSWNEGKEGEV